MNRLLKCAFWRFIRRLEHNEHHIPLRFRNSEIRACARCLGIYTGMIVMLPAMFILATAGQFDFLPVFSISWLFTLPAIIDWGTIKTKIRSGNNHVRLFTGFLLGMAGMMYLFLLPINPFYRVISLWIFAAAFDIVHYGVLCKEHGLSLRNPLRQNLTIIFASMPLTVVGQTGCAMTGGCGECCTCCPCGNCGSCLCCPLCCCIGVIPVVCIMKSSMDKAGGEHKLKFW